ncbi:MAG: hypothetical protein M1832_002010 [Thelocarpon impressellum]|nr:MAG: hypothetical protein M1832_002010 [Thelocarpon impressellum]
MPPANAIQRVRPTDATPPRPAGMSLTAKQKQALIDNLQLEVTSRARKLRAQYAMQAQGLRTRIEIRVNRVPLSLRQERMGALLAKYATDENAGDSAATAAAAIAAALPLKKPAPKKRAAKKTAGEPRRGTKRKSDALDPSDDKENGSLPVAKKRAKAAGKKSNGSSATLATTSTANTAATATARAHAAPTALTAVSTQRPPAARPLSPLKLAAPATQTGSRTTRAITSVMEKAKTTRAKAARKFSPAKATAPAPVAAVPAAKGKRGAAAAAGRQTAGPAAKKVDTAPPAERRVLRKRH